jgi:excisionase family DNA binding protein
MAILDADLDLDGAYSLAAFCRTYNVGLTFTYQNIKDGKLRAVKAGAKTLILRRDAEAWAHSLPEMRRAA